MNLRLIAFKSFYHCPVRRSLIKRLTRDDLIIIENLINLWADKNYKEFTVAINQYHVENINKNSKINDLCNLLGEANGVYYQRKIINK